MIRLLYGVDEVRIIGGEEGGRRGDQTILGQESCIIGFSYFLHPNKLFTIQTTILLPTPYPNTL
jgi:hypothetical protein